MRLDRQRLAQTAISQHLDASALSNQPALEQKARSHFGPGIEFGLERFDIYYLERLAVNVRKAARVRQAADERQLAAFKIGLDTTARARALTFCAASRRLALPGGNTATHATFSMCRTFGRFQIV